MPASRGRGAGSTWSSRTARRTSSWSSPRRYGTVLPGLGREVQANVAGVLRDSAGLVVDGVDVSIEELDG